VHAVRMNAVMISSLVLVVLGGVVGVYVVVVYVVVVYVVGGLRSVDEQCVCLWVWWRGVCGVGVSGIEHSASGEHEHHQTDTKQSRGG